MIEETAQGFRFLGLDGKWYEAWFDECGWYAGQRWEVFDWTLPACRIGVWYPHRDGEGE